MNKKIIITILLLSLAIIAAGTVSAENKQCEDNVGFTYKWLANEQPNRITLADATPLLDAMDELAESLTGNYEDYDLQHTYDNGTQVNVSSHDFNYYFKQVDLDNHTIWFYGDTKNQEFIYMER